ncbi:unnamed protein product [Gongylonema pulchrum]|uniref:Phosphoserine phosphatase n=1 Tax=Gongylonema pulchrum TaxID=637853 RepID=A0A183E6Z3_9BILA|nr:unnamed protein product [Gongylonema pulchrum]
MSNEGERGKGDQDEARRIWKNADAVCFDVDSTLCRDELLDELAKHLSCYELIASCTENAINGRISFRQSLKLRLDVMKPTRRQLEEFIRSRKPAMTPGSAELVAELHRRGTHVYLVSGSFRILVAPVARLLSIPDTNVFANELLFDANGRYSGFDETLPTSDSGREGFGKGAVCRRLKGEKSYRNLVMIGDGATDLEAACPCAADLFIGFGGVRCREVVMKNAQWFVRDFETLTECLVH